MSAEPDLTRMTITDTPPQTAIAIPTPVIWRPGRARNRVHQASLFARAAIAARRRRSSRQPDAAEALAGEQLLAALQALPVELVRECRLINQPCNIPPFLDTGIDLEAGEKLSTFSWGRARLSDPLDVWIGPHFQLWTRIGEGPVFRGTRATNTFTAEHSGRLRLASFFPAVWADQTGRLATSPRDFARIRGTISTIVVRWAPGADPLTVLSCLAVQTPSVSLAADEVQRIETRIAAPEGWSYAWQLGDAEIFRDAENTSEGICCHTHGDVACIQHDVDVPLTAATRLRWRWRFDQLPSALAEDSVVTHDYMSIAVEFDNGQDITYYWSAELPPGYAYPCPLAHWKYVETHIVLRSGSEQLGTWLSEDRPVQEDYSRAVGPPPERIVKIWLIGVSVFQRGTGSCQYADIELVGEAGIVRP
jgi:hypothetical protein